MSTPRTQWVIGTLGAAILATLIIRGDARTWVLVALVTLVAAVLPLLSRNNHLP